MKKFFKKTEGFTLVELIVVIAILGILAGVGTVGYSGYIKKANLAADQQLLAALNQAFAAACIENGEDAADVSASNITITDKKLGTLDVTAPVEKEAAIEASFAKYYAGNENAEFKVFDRLDYANGSFIGVDLDDPTAAGVYADLMQAIKESHSTEITALKNSTFGGTMGVSALMTQLDDVTVLAAGLAQTNDAVDNVLKSSGFINSAVSALGITSGELDTKLATLAAEVKAKNPGLSDADAIARVKANAAVLYTAQQTAGMTAEQATTLFNSASTAEILKNMTSTDSATSGKGMAQAALVCGMYTAYVNREGSTATDKTVNVDTVLYALNNDAAFKNYITTEQGKKDLDGYLGSLSILSSSATGSNAAEVENLMINGFNDPSLIAGISGLID